MARKGLNSTDFNNRNSGTSSTKISDSWDLFEKKHGTLSATASTVTTSTTVSTIAPSSKLKAGTGSSMSKNNKVLSCYETHPALILPGTDKVLYGGSCWTPAVTDADIYVGFDSGMKFTQRHWPWKKGQELLFKIQDGSVPENPEEFKKLVEWTIKRLDAGDKIHGGCIGGHGRTGMWLSAVVARLGEKDAIEYVREHYCKKAVENTQQVDFLHKHFDVKKAKGAKSWSTTSSISGGNTKLQPLKGNGSIWG